MRHARDIDTNRTALTPQDAHQQERDTQREEAVERRRQARATSEAATNRAIGSPEAHDFERRCIAEVERALDAYASGQAGCDAEIDEWRIEVPKKKFGIRVGTKKVENIETNWKYFRVRILPNGKTDRTTDADGTPLPYPIHEGYVLVIESRAPWVEKAIESRLIEAGYQRTIYVDAFFGNGFPLPTRQAYALPTRHL